MPCIFFKDLSIVYTWVFFHRCLHTTCAADACRVQEGIGPYRIHSEYIHLPLSPSHLSQPTASNREIPVKRITFSPCGLVYENQIILRLGPTLLCGRPARLKTQNKPGASPSHSSHKMLLSAQLVEWLHSYPSAFYAGILSG